MHPALWSHQLSKVLYYILGTVICVPLFFLLLKVAVNTFAIYMYMYIVFQIEQLMQVVAILPTGMYTVHVCRA